MVVTIHPTQAHRNPTYPHTSPQEPLESHTSQQQTHTQPQQVKSLERHTATPIECVLRLVTLPYEDRPQNKNLLHHDLHYPNREWKTKP